MDKYAFLLELNSNLELKITGNEINGDLGNLTFRISFTPDISLRVHTKAYLFGDYPMKDQVQGANEKTSCFALNDLFFPVTKQTTSSTHIHGQSLYVLRAKRARMVKMALMAILLNLFILEHQMVQLYQILH